MKVSELAAELKKQNKEIIDKAAELGIDARGATKNLSDSEAEKIRSGFDASVAKAAEDKKAKLMPRRISKIDVEAAERAKADAEAAEEEQRLREEEAAAKAAAQAAPRLKVAKQPEPAPKPPRTKMESGGADAAKPEEAGGAKTGKTDGAPRGEDDGAKMAPDGKTAKDAAHEAKTKPGENAEQAVSKADSKAAPGKAGEKPAADGKAKRPDGAHGAGTPGIRSDAQASARIGASPGAQGAASAAAPRTGNETKAKTPEAGAEKKEGAKEKKGGKAKDAKGADSAQSAAAKKKVKNAKKGSRVEDFRGPAKNPIIEDGSLEKEKRKKHRSGRPAGEAGEPLIVPEGTFVVNVPITLAGFAEQIEHTTSEVILALMKMGVMANINQNLDEETVQILADELDVPVIIGKDEGEIIEDGIEDDEDDEEDLVPRPPIITVMGHVDHGKTSLLDAIRNTNVTDKEAGGITQHIGASEVFAPSGERIVFLDTPGHEAFTAMRARGAHVTDIAVLVVAADDGVMPQTIESISHAKAAGVPIIVAINKIDKEGANPDLVKKELSDNGVLVEEWGGDVIAVSVSAKTGEGIGTLLDMILLQAEVLELRANPERLALGTVIEARLDKSKGPLATLLVLNGTLKDKMSIVAGTTSAKIRAMTDFKGKTIRSAGPATAIEITGFSEVPQAGDEFHALLDDKVAREIAEKRRIRQREQVMAKTSGTSLENLYFRIREGEIKELNVIIKADVMGSVGAIASSLEKIDVEGVRVNIIHRGVGTITESDVMLASSSGAIVIGFNVRPQANVTSLAEREAVEIRLYRVIYDVIGEIEAALKGMLDPVFREAVLGKAEVRETFRLPNGSQIAGSYVVEGKILRNAEIRLVRDGVVIHEGRVGSLRRFKDDVREVDKGYECGIGIESYNDIKAGDEIEAFRMEEIERD
ncbi:MAG: translation initiation factor IF-2 [Clostridiales Family XIII bacterium]|jgi:translation initiation factor IF-2|nr:translation initiation factor IF-2 [Clostridiales Family XIII bacterium]